jgi:exosortase/archaeosortase family protein
VRPPLRNLRFVFVLAAYAVVTWLVFRDEVMGLVLGPLRMWTAEAALTTIRLVGMEAARAGSVVYHPGGFAYEISRGCTGLVGAGLLVVAIAAYPASLGRRLVGISISVPTFLGWNLVRLVHLFSLGVHRPEVFHVYHEAVWQVGMAVAVFGLWFGWTIWANRPRDSHRQSRRPLSPRRRLRIAALGDLGS